MEKLLGTFLITSFFMSVISIELNRWGLLPKFIAPIVPLHHLKSIEFSFILLLFYEVISLILTIARSISNSVAKQLELLSLILLRDTFKNISNIDGSLSWESLQPILPGITASAVGALLIFVILIFYNRCHESHPFSSVTKDRMSFIKTKKIVALVLLFIFVGITFYNGFTFVFLGCYDEIFEILYTLLIFSNILIMLFSLRFSVGYELSFRNSAFAVTTVMITMSLIAPPIISAVLGVGAALFALGIITAYNYALVTEKRKDCFLPDKDV